MNQYLSSSAIWTRVHTIHYRQLTNSSSTVPAVSTAIGGANTTTSTTSFTTIVLIHKVHHQNHRKKQ